MSTVQHTPGPWRVEECGAADCWCRIIVSDVPDAEDDFTVINAGSLRAHNAALIAAAPDLLAALREARDLVSSDYTGRRGDLTGGLLGRIDAAIAKATGGAS